MNPAIIVALIGALPLLLQLITSIISAVENAVSQAQANGTISAPVTGADKLTGALSLFQALWPAISSTGTGAKLAAVTTPDQLTQIVTDLINTSVAFFNQIGIFKKSTPAPAQPAPST